MDSSEDFSVSTHDLVHAGLQDLRAAARGIEEMRRAGANESCLHALLDALERTCDPDVALRNLVDVLQSEDGTHPRIVELVHDADAMRGLVGVLGISDALGKLMRSRPELAVAAAEADGDVLHLDGGQRLRRMLGAIGADGSQANRLTSPFPFARAVAGLRREYRLQLAAIMAMDAAGDDPMAIQPAISEALSDLADAALQGALAIARHETDGSGLCRFAIIGMGKLGARELNYVSDVDLMYVVEAGETRTDVERLTKIAVNIAVLFQKICQSTLPEVSEPPLWQIDTALRPEGKNGPLVRRLQSYEDYYRQWAENWEFQALLKARPVAGDRVLGREYMDMTRPMVWVASQRDNFVHDCQLMRKRVEDLIPEPLKDREIKLGRGGLRDVEFTVQMLQLVHGRSDESLRVSSTLNALRALSEGGYVSRRQAARLAADYRFERVMEHRVQMWSLKRTHLFPDLGSANKGGMEHNRNISLEEVNANQELRRLARAFHKHPEELVAAYDATRREIRRLHLDIYYRPMLPISAQTDADQISLPADVAAARLESIGFKDPIAATRHMKTLTTGVSRAAKINRILLPAVLQWLGHGQDPDMGLLNWSKLEQHFGTGSQYLGFLRDSPSAAQRLCHVLSNSRFLGDALNRSAESVTWLGDDDKLRTRSRESLDVQCAATLERTAGRVNEFANSLRAMRRHEIERIGLGWMSGVLDDATCLGGMTDVYDALIDAALAWGMRHACEILGVVEAPAAICAIGMGRYGGREVNFSSDADLIIVYRPQNAANDDEANHFARQVLDDMRSVLQGPVTLEPKLELDFDLRPEGRNGPLVRSYTSCELYYRSWASTWERQALLRARLSAGDAKLGDDFLHNIVDPLRYSCELGEAQINEIQRLKARMEAERLPRGVRRDRHLKLGKGGLSDVEWAVQLLQLRHAREYPQLRETSTLPTLRTLERLALIDSGDAEILGHAWRTCTAARNGNYLWSGRTALADILPNDLYSLGGIAVYLGYGAHRGQYFENELLSVMRRCREAVERLFYGP